MSGPDPLAIATGALLDTGLKATAVMVCAVLAQRALRHRSAAEKHAGWAIALLALPLVPMVSLQRGAQLAVDAPGIFLLWIAGVGLNVLWMASGLWRLHQMTMRAQASPTEHTVRYLESLTTPLTWGTFRPVILLPMASKHWSEARQVAARLHEQAHIQRCDWLIYVLTRAIVSLLWFHPLVWWMHRQLIREAEHAADDQVLAAGVIPSDYASLLLRIAAPQRSLALALAAAQHDIKHRIFAILGRRNRTQYRAHIGIAACCFVMMGLPTLAATPLWHPTPEASQTCQPGQVGGTAYVDDLAPPPLLAR